MLDPHGLGAAVKRSIRTVRRRGETLDPHELGAAVKRSIRTVRRRGETLDPHELGAAVKRSIRKGWASRYPEAGEVSVCIAAPTG
jgi:hypothetical protein